MNNLDDAVLNLQNGVNQFDRWIEKRELGTDPFEIYGQMEEVKNNLHSVAERLGDDKRDAPLQCALDCLVKLDEMLKRLHNSDFNITNEIKYIQEVHQGVLEKIVFRLRDENLSPANLELTLQSKFWNLSSCIYQGAISTPGKIWNLIPAIRAVPCKELIQAGSCFLNLVEKFTDIVEGISLSIDEKEASKQIEDLANSFFLIKETTNLHELNNIDLLETAALSLMRLEGSLIAIESKIGDKTLLENIKHLEKEVEKAHHDILERLITLQKPSSYYQGLSKLAGFFSQGGSDTSVPRMEGAISNFKKEIPEIIKLAKVMQPDDFFIDVISSETKEALAKEDSKQFEKDYLRTGIRLHISDPLCGEFTGFSSVGKVRELSDYQYHLDGFNRFFDSKEDDWNRFVKAAVTQTPLNGLLIPLLQLIAVDDGLQRKLQFGEEEYIVLFEPSPCEKKINVQIDRDENKNIKSVYIDVLAVVPVQIGKENLIGDAIPVETLGTMESTMSFTLASDLDGRPGGVIDFTYDHIFNDNISEKL